MAVGKWKSKPDFHFPTATAATTLGLHFKCLDDLPFGYILKWLDRPSATACALCSKILCLKKQALEPARITDSSRRDIRSQFPSAWRQCPLSEIRIAPLHVRP